MFTLYHQILDGMFNPDLLSNKVGKLGEQDVHLWRINKNYFNGLRSYSDYYLNKDEQKRAQRFRFRKDHDLFVIGRYLSKILIAYYTNNKPENVTIIPDEFGKPVCEMNLHFNLSHSGDLLLLGFSKSLIGVDIEKIDPTWDIDCFCERHFTEMESQKIMNGRPADKTNKFYEIWTKKESLIKGIGKGLSLPLKDFNVTAPDTKVLWEFPTEYKQGNWQVHTIVTNQGYKSAFATQNANVIPHYFLTE